MVFPDILEAQEDGFLGGAYANLAALLEAIKHQQVADDITDYAVAARNLAEAGCKCNRIFKTFKLSEIDEGTIHEHVCGVIDHYEEALNMVQKYGGEIGLLLGGVHEELEDTLSLLSAFALESTKDDATTEDQNFTE